MHYNTTFYIYFFIKIHFNCNNKMKEIMDKVKEKIQSFIKLGIVLIYCTTIAHLAFYTPLMYVYVHTVSSKSVA